MTAALVVRNEGGNTRRVGARGVRVVERMARQGCSETTIAKALRLGRDTFRAIKNRQPEVAEALERGYSGMEDELVDLLMTCARKGNVTAAIFLLKSRRGYENTKLPPHITINQDNRRQTIVLPSPLDMDEYRRRYLAEPGGA